MAFMTCLFSSVVFLLFPAAKGDFASLLSAGLSLWFVVSGNAKKESARAEIPAGKGSSREVLLIQSQSDSRSAFHPDVCVVPFCPSLPPGA